MAATKESLEERLERIRLKNEEIEKKHREAEQDRLRALKVRIFRGVREEVQWGQIRGFI